MVSCGGVLFRHEAIRAEESEAAGSGARRECSTAVDQGVRVPRHDEAHRHTKGVPCGPVCLCDL